MPEQDGFEILRQLRSGQKTAELPVLLLTDDEEPETVQRGFACGADELLRKPVVPELLLHRVRHLTELAVRRGLTLGTR